MCISNQNTNDKYRGIVSDRNCGCIGYENRFSESQNGIIPEGWDCGGFTTFSSFALEMTDLMKDGRMHLATIYTVLSVTLGVLAVFAGQGIVGKE